MAGPAAAAAGAALKGGASSNGAAGAAAGDAGTSGGTAAADGAALGGGGRRNDDDNKTTKRLLLIVLCCLLPLIVGIAVIGGIFGALTNPCDPGSSATGTGPGPAPNAFATKDIPAAAISAYRRAGGRYGQDWRILAGIGWVESTHGTSTLPGVRSGMNDAGAAGPMQIGISATCPNGMCAGDNWSTYGMDGDGDGKKDVYDIDDAAMGAAKYLSNAGAPGNWQTAIFAYNHAQWYVDDVIERARLYGYDGDGIRNGKGVSDAPTTGLDAATEAAAGRSATGKADGADGKMVWPTAVHAITSGFGPRNCLGCSRFHEGLDIGAQEGDQVHAALQGRITFRGVLDGYGNYLCMTHSAKLTTCYAHLSAFGRWGVNDTIKQGALIGYVGHTGGDYAPHLHFEVRLGPDLNSKAVDARPYLDGAMDAPADDDTGTAATGETCSSDELGGGGTAELSQSNRVTTPREMTYLPAWATADGYTSAAIIDGRARVDARIVPDILWMLKHYNLRVRDCLASGHNTHGTGDSCDIVPADDPNPRPGRMTPGWKNVTQLAEDLGWRQPGPGYPGGNSCNSGSFVPAIYIVCYNGDSNHGDPEHITGPCACPHLHVTFNNPVIGAATAMATPPEWVDTFPVTPDDGQAPDGRTVLIGDSLGVGIEPYLAEDLGKKVDSDTREGRTLAQGMQIIRGLQPKPAALAVSLFTNDDPRDTVALATAVRESLTAVKDGGCVVWATIARPPVNGHSYDAANAKLRQIAQSNDRVQLADWAAYVDQHPNVVGSDGVHASPSGYQIRAGLYAQALKRCTR
ncbi:MAG: peptidoglycan DD-metalloendopeptidase family protein [Vicinamibacterales bacterium]